MRKEKRVENSKRARIIRAQLADLRQTIRSRQRRRYSGLHYIQAIRSCVASIHRAGPRCKSGNRTYTYVVLRERRSAPSERCCRRIRPSPVQLRPASSHRDCMRAGSRIDASLAASWCCVPRRTGDQARCRENERVRARERGTKER